MMSNYDKLCEKWRQEFLQMDVEDLMKKLSELKIENDCLVLWHFGSLMNCHRTLVTFVVS